MQKRRHGSELLHWPRHRQKGGDRRGQKHWHGAAPDSAMTHIAIQENLEGKTDDWREQVSNEQYLGNR